MRWVDEAQKRVSLDLLDRRHAKKYISGSHDLEPPKSYYPWQKLICAFSRSDYLFGAEILPIPCPTHSYTPSMHFEHHAAHFGSARIMYKYGYTVYLR
jgi:hypothetical protein